MQPLLTTLTNVRSGPCNFSSGTGHCNDAGYVWDLSSDVTVSELMPCPACNTVAYLESARETAETQAVGWYDGVPHSGVEVWVHAVTLALQWNASTARQVLYRFGFVNAIETAGSGYRVRPFAYNVTR